MHQFGNRGGTTASVVLIKDQTLFIANVGDSRIVLKQEGKILQLTKDHKHTDPEEYQNYLSSKWFTEKSRLVSQGKIKGFYFLAVSRSLGDGFFEDAISPIPDTYELKLKGNEKIVFNGKRQQKPTA